MKIRIFKDIEGLETVRQAWSELLEKSDSRDIFLRPEWIFAWWRVFGKNKTLFFVTTWSEGRLIGIFPLCKYRKGAFRIITFLGYPDQSDRMDFILSKEEKNESLRLFVNWMASRRDWDIVKLERFGCFTDSAVLLEEAARKTNLRGIFNTSDSFLYIDTSRYSGFEGYLQKTTKSRNRKVLRKERERINNVYKANWERVNDLDEDIVTEMAELDTTRSIRGMKKESFFHEPKNRQFVLELAKEMSGKKMIEMFFIRIGEQISSYLMAFIEREKLLAYQMAYDREYGKVGVGMQTLLESVKFAFDSGIKNYEFLRGSEAYKGRWSEVFRESRSVYIYNHNLMGSFLYFYRKKIKPIRERLGQSEALQRRIPDWLRKLDL